MALIKDFNNIYPKIDDTVYLSENVSVIGDVRIKENSSIWFNAVLRGDVASIEIGKNTNIQDSVVIHSSRINGPTIIGDNVTIGHKALVHACRVHDNAFIGMNSTIMDRVVIEEYGFVSAGALIPPKKIVKSKELWAGVPAKFIRYLTEMEVQEIINSAKYYFELSRKYL